jgi:hypothetical protein
LRREFDAVREWVATNNTFKPPKLSGSLLYLDSHKAWSQRLRPDATPKRQVKKLTAKELRQLVEAYRSMLDRSGGVITKWRRKMEPKKRGGWPKGRLRGPRKPKEEVQTEEPQTEESTA